MTMKKQIGTRQKNKIIHLDRDEIVQPLNFIDYFFESSCLPEHLNVLRKWRDDVAFDPRDAKKRSPADILYDYELTVKLVEAAWLLKKKNRGDLKIGRKDWHIGQLHIKKERKKMEYFPTSLDFQELLKPSRVLKNIFRTFELHDYQRILYIWLSDAMSAEFFEENLTKYEVIKVYENLIKMFEVMWLINERNRNKKVGKKRQAIKQKS